MIIICDDDPIFGKKLKNILEKRNIEDVFHFISCSDMLDYLNNIKNDEIYPKLVFLDLMMPVTDGYECMGKIKENFPPFPVIGMTSGTEGNPGIDSSYAGELFKLCIQAIIIKSHDTKRLIKYIDAIDKIWINNPIQPVFDRNNKNRDNKSEEKSGRINKNNGVNT